MKTKSSIFIVAAMSLPLVYGCATETVDKGPPKFGQTVERPHTDQDVIAEERANQVQQDTSQPKVVVPNGTGNTNNAAQASATSSNNNSIFTTNNGSPPVTNNNTSAPPSNGDTRGGINSANTNYGTNGTVRTVPEPGFMAGSAASAPQGSPLTPNSAK